jgi:bacillithiol system protein YtxJ
MGLFEKIFKGNTETKKEEVSKVHWIPVTTASQIRDLKELSKREVVAIFKHSTRCSISRMVLKQFENKFDDALKELKVYYVDILNYREISNEIGAVFQVLHQSPQLLLIKNEEVIDFASHYDITTIDLKKHVLG